MFGVRVDITSMGGPREPKPERLALARGAMLCSFCKSLGVFTQKGSFFCCSPSYKQSICLFSLDLNLMKFECELAPISAMTATVSHADYSLRCL